MADIDPRRFGPGADHRGGPKAPLGGAPGFAVPGIVAGAGEAGGREPWIEEGGGFKGGLGAGALSVRDLFAKIHQLPERRTRARTSGSGAARVRVGRHRVDAGFETAAFVFEGVALRLQRL